MTAASAEVQQLSALPSQECNRHSLGCQGCTFKASVWPGHILGGFPFRGARAAPAAVVGFHTDPPIPPGFSCSGCAAHPCLQPWEPSSVCSVWCQSCTQHSHVSPLIFCSAKEAALPHFRGFSVRTKTQNMWKHGCSKRRLITQYRTFSSPHTVDHLSGRMWEMKTPGESSVVL